MLYTDTIKDPAIFSRCYKKGKRIHGPGVTAYCFFTNRPYNAFGITAGKKVGGAVQRNRAKRILRAAYRKNELLLPIGYDIVIAAGQDIVGKKSDSFDGFFKKLSLELTDNRK